MVPLNLHHTLSSILRRAQFLFEGLGGAVEVDEAEDYEAPGLNSGQEI
jgi:hypothetical protein